MTAVFKIVAKFGLPALALAFTLPAFASEVSYSTTGMFSASGTSTFTDGVGGGTAVFAGNADDIDTPHTDSLGTITVTVPASGSITGSGTFTLSIDQPVPGGSGDIGSSFSGTITRNPLVSGSLVLTFNQTSITIDNVTYTLEDLGQNGLAANQLGIGNGINNIEAGIAAATPEPTFMLLSGLGFAGLAFAAYRRKRTA